MGQMYVDRTLLTSTVNQYARPKTMAGKRYRVLPLMTSWKSFEPLLSGAEDELSSLLLKASLYSKRAIVGMVSAYTFVSSSEHS